MPISIEPYTSDHVAAAHAFVQRLRAGGEEQFGLPSSPISDWLPRETDPSLFEEYFLATDGDFVRGGYVLKHQQFRIGHGAAEHVGFIYSPVSESVVDARFGSLGMRLIGHALKQSPLLYALGMGGLGYPLPRLLAAMGWKLFSVPFYLRVVNPSNFLRNLAYLRRVPGADLAMKFLASTGVGWAGLTLLNQVVTRSPSRADEVTWSLVQCFPADVDAIWNAAQTEYSFTAVRDQRVLDRLYPARYTRLLRLLVSRGDRLVGWALLTDTPMNDDKFFGSARVGMLVDCLALSGHEVDVVHASARFLEQRGVDAIVSNQSHDAWCSALRRGGWLPVPSNFVFAASPKLVARLENFDESQCQFHVNRGDGHGP